MNITPDQLKLFVSVLFQYLEEKEESHPLAQMALRFFEAGLLANFDALLSFLKSKGL